MVTARVKVKNLYGEYIIGRALLDTCATAHFVTKQFAEQLQLPSSPCSIPIGAINDMNTVSRGSIEFSIQSIHNNFQRSLSFLIVPKIADNVPSEVFPRNSIKIPANIRLADPQFHLPQPVDVLIGSGVTLAMLSIGQINLSQRGSDLILQKTRLGWVAAGGVASGGSMVSCKLTELTQQIAKFWLLDDSTSKQIRSSESADCEIHYVQNVTRNSSGRYIVRLPFRASDRDLGNSRSIALRRFHSLQRKLNADASLKKEYERVMEEYIDLGHMTLVTNESSQGYFLPHHPVIKSTSATTKVRVVFDASAKTDKGLSLNDILMVGPTIQLTLFKHLLRFRIYKYVLIADIAKMYRQIILHPDDRVYQQIFWYHDDKIRVFQLNTVTFGVSSAPFLAIRTLHQLADDEGMNFPIGSKILKRDLYVDDLLTGANTFEELIAIRNEIIQISKCGGFNVRQWASNHSRALENVDENSSDIEFFTDENPIRKTLGISWNACHDKFIYTIKPIENTDRITKRYILAEISKIFDPLGLLSPIILVSKIIMQECWKADISWDESVPNDLYTKWHTFSGQLELIDNLMIDRHVLINDSIDTQIHGFCDASSVGYGACLYVRSRNEQGEIRVRLLCAKGRVAPIVKNNNGSKSKKPLKPTLTIPRLELCGALTLARLFSEVRTTLTLDVHHITFWSDSTIVLQWLKKHPSALKLFESNRVAEIQTTVGDAKWEHVRSENNPADALSRGQLPREFIKNESWFQGPRWLNRAESEWPNPIMKCDQPLPGLKQVTCFIIETKFDEIYQRFSSYRKMIRVIAYCLRIKTYKRIKKTDKISNLTISELDEAERRVIKLIQQERFGDEIKRLKQGKEAKSAKIGSLAPMINENDILCVGGRLKHAKLPIEQKQPILLPARHPVTDLFIQHTHEKFHHTGIQSTLHNTRHRFWIIDGKNQVRRIIHHCIKCTRFRAKPVNYKMADLPRFRTDGASAFYHTGLDYFGPMYAKEKARYNRNRIKVWGCVFICMNTKAVHLEIVSDMTTAAFLATLRRFTARRGTPTHIYSDNGSNFIGANNQLLELYVLMQSSDFQDQVNNYALEEKIMWHFNPPLSPHFGGIWEAAVKSCKHHFKRVVGDHLFTYEQLTTLATEIEAILNSRPLSPLSSDPNDPRALTPAHILIGKPFTMLPENNFTNVSDNRLSTWEAISKARQHFWQRWQLEYLTELQKRQKWIKPEVGLKQNDIVVLIDKNLPCMQWRLGRVVDLHPGDDGTVRVVSVKTSQGTFKRNSKTLCLLPVES